MTKESKNAGRPEIRFSQVTHLNILTRKIVKCFVTLLVRNINMRW